MQMSTISITEELLSLTGKSLPNSTFQKVSVASELTGAQPTWWLFSGSQRRCVHSLIWQKHSTQWTEEECGRSSSSDSAVLQSSWTWSSSGMRINMAKLGAIVIWAFLDHQCCKARLHPGTDTSLSSAWCSIKPRKLFMMRIEFTSECLDDAHLTYNN